jgi:cell surface protein SprA
LANDEVLAVAYQYTIGDKAYQVGEFGSDGIDATIVILLQIRHYYSKFNLKMLKSNLTNVKIRFGI